MTIVVKHENNSEVNIAAVTTIKRIAIVLMSLQYSEKGRIKITGLA